MKRKVLFVLLVLSVFVACLTTNGGIMAQNVSDIENSLVEIEYSEGQGTGFFINETQIVTNHHVVSKASIWEDPDWFESVENNVVQVYYSVIGRDFIDGVVVADWPEVDLAIVQISKDYSKRQPVTLIDPKEIKVGMDIWSAGFPGITDTDEISSMDVTITKGIITKINSTAHFTSNSTPFVQLAVDAMINAGASGGPIVDEHGHVVGINDYTRFSQDEDQAWFGISVGELITRLNTKGFTYSVENHDVQPVDPTPAPVDPTPVVDWTPTPTPDSKPNYTLWILIGVLCVAVIALVIVLVNRGKKSKKTQTGSGKNTGGSSAGGPSIQGMSGQFLGVKKALTPGKDCTFGTNPDCTFSFSKNAGTISNKHCRIHYSQSNRCYVIQDLNSTNGTVIVRGSSRQQVPANSGIELRNGDQIYIVDKNNSFKVNL